MATTSSNPPPLKIFNHPRPKKSVLATRVPKKRKTDHKIAEISFDFDARADYLTGFHKRKLERAKRAQAEAKKKEREEKIGIRKQVCSFSSFFLGFAEMDFDLGER